MSSLFCELKGVLPNKRRRTTGLGLCQQLSLPASHLHLLWEHCPLLPSFSHALSGFHPSLAHPQFQTLRSFRIPGHYHLLGHQQQPSPPDGALAWAAHLPARQAVVSIHLSSCPALSSPRESACAGWMAWLMSTSPGATIGSMVPAEKAPDASSRPSGSPGTRPRSKGRRRCPPPGA